MEIVDIFPCFFVFVSPFNMLIIAPDTKNIRSKFQSVFAYYLVLEIWTISLFRDNK